MTKTHNTQGIVLSQKDWRENDRLFLIYTKDFGKLQLLGVGMKKIKSKLAGHLTTPGMVDLMLVKSRNFDRIGSAYLKQNFNFDYLYDQLYYSVIFEVLDLAFDFGQKDLEIWNLTVKTLETLPTLKQLEQKQILVLSYIFSLMILAGYKPHFESCFICKKNNNLDKFSLIDNAFICSDCNGENIIKVNFELLRLLGQLQKKKSINNFCLKKKDLKEIIAFVKVWLPYLLEKPVNSIKYL